MLGPYLHQIDPILLEAGGVLLWWYGRGDALGFLELHPFRGRVRRELQMSRREVWTLTLFVTSGVLLGGRAVEVAFDEWPFYRERPGSGPGLLARGHGYPRPAARRGSRGGA